MNIFLYNCFNTLRTEVDRILYTVIPVLDSSSWCEKLKVLLQKQRRKISHHRYQAMIITELKPCL